MIRSATEEDLDEMARLHALCFAKAWDAQALADLLKTPGVLALVAPHGFVMARVASDEAEILTLAVAPEARGRGLGRALVQEAAGRVAAEGAVVLLLEAGRANDAARALYEQLGFVEAGTRKSYYEGGEDALILRRDLPLAPLGKGR